MVNSHQCKEEPLKGKCLPWGSTKCLKWDRCLLSKLLVNNNQAILNNKLSSNNHSSQEFNKCSLLFQILSMRKIKNLRKELKLQLVSLLLEPPNLRNLLKIRRKMRRGKKQRKKITKRVQLNKRRNQLLEKIILLKNRIRVQELRLRLLKLPKLKDHKLQEIKDSNPFISRIILKVSHFEIK